MNTVLEHFVITGERKNEPGVKIFVGMSNDLPIWVESFHEVKLFESIQEANEILHRDDFRQVVKSAGAVHPPRMFIESLDWESIKIEEIVLKTERDVNFSEVLELCESLCEEKNDA